MIIVIFLMALAADLLSCEWHAARERGQLAKLGFLSAVIEALNWFPIFVVIVTQSIPLVIASIAGAVIGGVWGGARERARATLEEDDCPCHHCVANR